MQRSSLFCLLPLFISRALNRAEPTASFSSSSKSNSAKKAALDVSRTFSFLSVSSGNKEEAYSTARPLPLRLNCFFFLFVCLLFPLLLSARFFSSAPTQPPFPSSYLTTITVGTVQSNADNWITKQVSETLKWVKLAGTNPGGGLYFFLLQVSKP